MSDMADRLRSSHGYIATHRVFSHDVMLEAADHIERLEEQAAGAKEYIKEIEDAVTTSHDRWVQLTNKVTEAQTMEVHATALLQDLHYELAEAHRSGCSSNDLAQAVDDWFTRQGFPTIIYG